MVPEPYVADNYVQSQDTLELMPESLKALGLFLRESISYYEKNEETYDEWFRKELSYTIEDFASKRPALRDIKRLIAGLGPG